MTVFFPLSSGGWSVKLTIHRHLVPSVLREATSQESHVSFSRTQEKTLLLPLNSYETVHVFTSI